MADVLLYNRSSVVGVPFDIVTQSEVRVRIVRQLLQGANVLTIFTPNPEMVVKASRDKIFKTVLQNAGLSLCDGRGTELVLRYFNQVRTVERLTGVDTTLMLCGVAEELQKRVFLLGGDNDETVVRAARELTRLFPRLCIAGYDKGPMLQESSDGSLCEPPDTPRIIANIAHAEPDILIVAFGMGKQEKWIMNHRTEFPTLRIAIGVGGTFSFLSGDVPRAPRWMRTLGLEWLFRWYQEPWRARRMWRATGVFGYYVVRSRFFKKDAVT